MYEVIFVVVSAYIAWEVNKTLPSPFIDEIFHIPQTQQYCNGSFYEWDAKITTPPGLYFCALLLNLPLKIFGGNYFCSVAALRAVNVFFNTLSLVLLQRIVFEIHGAKKSDSLENSKLQGFTLALFPLTYFFSFLYYTDPGSTMLVLAAYLANLRSQHKVSALLGFCSVLFRQTNIVWVVFLAGNVVVKEMVKAEDIKKIETSPEVEDKLARFLVNIVAAAVKYLLVIANLIKIVTLVWPYLSVVGLFAVFLVMNEGIVLGDRQSHVAVFHGVQVLYFFAFALFFASPHLVSISFLRNFLTALKRNPKKFVFLTIIFVYFILRRTYIHMYLLADNRHYTFYLCRYFLSRSVLRFAALPLYVYGGWAINEALAKPKCSNTWKLMFMVCVLLTTIPQKLIEMRYFILPYILLRVNLPVKRTDLVILELLLYLFVNAVTLFIFFTKPVAWPDIDMPQRIIW